LKRTGIDRNISIILKYRMPRVKVLPVELRNKIAAGEVIERPASVVKELTENSIDAGCSNITIEVLHGGKGLIKVADDGVGMEREDALLCLERHATSKLKDENDLFNITTMGFRGEALPSVASVSRMSLVSGPGDAASGVAIEISGGEIKEIKDFPARGTTVEVRDLFFNIPARKKFLKSDATELFHVIDAVTKEALSHWTVGFRLLTGKHETMSLVKAADARERIIQIYGLEFMEGLIETGSERPGMKLTAFVTKGDNFRNSRSHQYIFINGRPVKNQTISHAVYMAFEGILPRDKHPVFFLFLDVDPKRVDVNVHPTKREVRFENKDEIHRFVAAVLREAIRKERTEYIEPFTEAPSSSSPFVRGEGLVAESAPTAYQSPSQSLSSEPLELGYRPFLPFIYLGDTFIAMAGKGGLTLIDHHAAHERILFESFLKRVNLNSHALLFPKQVKLSHKEYRVVLDNKGLLEELGMEIDDFGHDTLIVRSLPDSLKDADLRGILSDIASALLEGIQPFSSLQELLAARIACHSSVRGKEILHQEELQRLLSNLEKTENPDQCPHGRPTRIFLSLDDLKKLFKRK
jgi:DNA mismatch repair protein MutL